MAKWHTELFATLTLPVKKKYIVRLTEAERSILKSLIHRGKEATHKRLHAEILLKADISENGGKWMDKQHALVLAYHSVLLNGYSKGWYSKVWRRH